MNLITLFIKIYWENIKYKPDLRLLSYKDLYRNRFIFKMDDRARGLGV